MAVLLLLCGIPCRNLLAAACTSTGTGDWSDPIWNCGHIPTTGDTVTIRGGDTVTVNTAVAQSSGVAVNGTLKFSRLSSSTLTVTGGDVVVNSGGTLDLGTAGDPISNPAVSATLLLPQNHSLTINSGGSFFAYGSAKSHAAQAVAGLAVNSLSVLVPASQAVGWQINDWITIGQTGSPGVDQTELRQITAISGTDPLTVTWVGGLSYAHSAAGPIRVGNLTRNVAIRSSGATPATILAPSFDSGSFQACLTEFDSLAGVVISWSVGGVVVSSCSFHHTIGTSMSFVHSSGAVVTNNIVYRASGGGLSMGGASYRVQDNDISSAVGSGIQVDDEGPGGNIIERNHVYAVDGAGIEYTNYYSGLGSFISGNYVYANAGGIRAFTDGSVIVGNRTHDNYYSGLQVSGGGNHWFVSNEVYGNGDGAWVDDGAGGIDNCFLNNTFYDNVNTGLYLQQGGVQVRGNRFGYDEAGVSHPDTKEIDGTSSSVLKLALRDNRVNPAVPLAPSTFLTRAGNYLVSYNQELAAGTARVYGDYTVSGSTLSLDFSQPLYASSASAVRLLRGTGHAGSVASTSGNAVTQLVTIRCVNGAANQWQVEGSESGLLYGPFTGGLTNQSVGGQFTLTFTPGGTRNTDDRVVFLLMAASQDAGVQKQLLFGSAGSALNGGKSKLTVAPGAGLSLQGTAASPTLVDRVSASDAYYTLVSSGAFTLVHGRVQNADLNGVQLSGSDGVLISSSTFDWMGVAAGQTNAYVTARSLTSSATFYAVHFDASRSTTTAGGAYNVRVVTPGDGGLSWYFRGHAGALTGESYNLDPNNRVTWAENVPPSSPPGFTSAPGTNEGEILLSWNSPGDDGMTGNIVGGSFRISYSTNPADLASASAESAMIVITTTAVANTPQSHTFTDLSLQTSYYFLLWVGDELNNISSLPSAATAQARWTAPQAAANFAATVQAGQVTLTWTAPPSPATPYLAGYSLDASSVSASGPYSTVDSNIPSMATSYLHAGLAAETTYYYRLFTVDVVGHVSPSSSINIKTPDISPPAPVNDLAAASGAALGTVDLTFTFRGDNGGSKALESGGSYRVQYSTLTAGVVWSTGSAQAVMPSGSVLTGTVVTETVGGFTEDGTYYFRIWTVDKWGNASDMDTTTPQASAVPRTQSPRASLIPLDSSAAAYPWNQAFTVSFTKAIDPSTLTGFTVAKVRDRMGNAVNQAVSGSTAAVGTDNYQFTPSVALDGNSLYEVRVTTTVKDSQGNALAQEVTGWYMTFLHRGEENVVTGLNGATVDIPANTLSSDGYLNGAAAPDTTAATQKLITTTGDALRTPVAGSVAPVNIFDLSGNPMTPSSPVTVSIPFTTDGKGFISGTNVKPKTLAVYVLDEARKLWLRLPSQVDTVAGRVTAESNRLSLFAAIGQADTDLTTAYAFPVPFSPSQNGGVISFVGVGPSGKIRIYTVSGRLVRELNPAEGASEVDWDARNKEGESVASGLYFYEITAGGNRKTGKLVVKK